MYSFRCPNHTPKQRKIRLEKNERIRLPIYFHRVPLYYLSMKRIYELCPSLAYMEFEARQSALIRMCIAHALNGGAFTGLYSTAIEYLESL